MKRLEFCTKLDKNIRKIVNILFPNVDVTNVEIAMNDKVGIGVEDILVYYSLKGEEIIGYKQKTISYLKNDEPIIFTTFRFVDDNCFMLENIDLNLVVNFSDFDFLLIDNWVQNYKVEVERAEIVINESTKVEHETYLVEDKNTATEEYKIAEKVWEIEECIKQNIDTYQFPKYILIALDVVKKAEEVNYIETIINEHGTKLPTPRIVISDNSDMRNFIHTIRKAFVELWDKANIKSIYTFNILPVDDTFAKLIKQTKIKEYEKKLDSFIKTIE